MPRNPEAYTEYNGRRCTATIEVVLLIKGEATERQIADWLDYEIGGGSIATANPLVGGDTDASFDMVDVGRVRLENAWSYTDWNAEKPDGSRSGRGRVEREPPAKVPA